jgi:hypothetical protein
MAELDLTEIRLDHRRAGAERAVLLTDIPVAANVHPALNTT